MPDARKLNPHDERRVAVAAGCDPRSVRAYLAERFQTSTLAARVSAALAQLGLTPDAVPPALVASQEAK